MDMTDVRNWREYLVRKLRASELESDCKGIYQALIGGDEFGLRGKLPKRHRGCRRKFGRQLPRFAKLNEQVGSRDSLDRKSVK